MKNQDLYFPSNKCFIQYNQNAVRNKIPQQLNRYASYIILKECYTYHQLLNRCQNSDLIENTPHDRSPSKPCHPNPLLTKHGYAKWLQKCSFQHQLQLINLSIHISHGAITTNTTGQSVRLLANAHLTYFPVML